LTEDCWLGAVSATPKAFAEKNDRHAAKMIVGAFESSADEVGAVG
jgi:hypothetical protein